MYERAAPCLQPGTTPLRIEIVKRLDSSGVLRCTRPDGSVTWQRQSKHAAHFALYHLTHYAVETILGHRRASFGLIAEGWDMDDVTGKGWRGALPPEAIEAERIVGAFDAERASGTLWTLEEFSHIVPRAFTSNEVQGIRALRASLFQRWRAVELGETLEVAFDPTSSV